MKLYSFEEIQDEFIGKRGTKAHEKYEQKLKRSKATSAKKLTKPQDNLLQRDV
ncbi:MAG TPA: hypothetical protein VEC36_12890 [Patescibacteria group bacterium]|nr:hypothetical protein [Patescibacteria group bacterium]